MHHILHLKRTLSQNAINRHIFQLDNTNDPKSDEPADNIKKIVLSIYQSSQ